MNRRTMLGTTTALIGGAIAGPEHRGVGGRWSARRQGRERSQPESAGGAGQRGKLRGLREGKTSSFLGIRYAEAERFGLPKPVQPGKASRSAQVWGPVCPAPEQTTVGSDELVFPHRYWIANEHCQYLNVWTPEPHAGRRRSPSWSGCTAAASPTARRWSRTRTTAARLSEFGDVVVVSVNHRLNILGTLDLSAYGSAVRELAPDRHGRSRGVARSGFTTTSRRFGGDPGNVMIFGQSGGGGKVVRLMHMPAAKGLFHKVVGAERRQQQLSHTDPAASIKAQQAHRRAHAQEPEPHRQRDRQAEDRALLGAASPPAPPRCGRRRRKLGAGRRRLEPDRRRSVRDARVLRLGRHHSAHGRHGVQRDAGHAHARRRPQERMDAEGNRRAADHGLRRQEGRRRRRIQAGVPAQEGAGRALLRRRLAAGRQEPAERASSRKARRRSTTTCSRGSTRSTAASRRSTAPSSRSASTP